MLGGERYFVADALFLYFASGDMQPAFGRKVSRNPFFEYRLFQEDRNSGARVLKTNEACRSLTACAKPPLEHADNEPS